MRLSTLRFMANRFSEENPMLGGYGGRMSQNKKITGMTLSSLKHHSALIPLFVIMGAGMAMVVAFSVRSITKTYDVSWKKEEDPYQVLRGKQYKFLNPAGVDYSKAGKDIPNYKD